VKSGKLVWSWQRLPVGLLAVAVTAFVAGCAGDAGTAAPSLVATPQPTSVPSFRPASAGASSAAAFSAPA